jgi:DNA mismatch repair protein MutS2
MEVAREYGLPESVLDKARQYLLLDGADTQQLLARLNDLAVAREEELARVREQALALAEQKAKLAKVFERDKAALLLELKKQTQDVLRLMREEKIGRRQALRELGQVRRTLEVQERQDELKTRDGWEAFFIGQRVDYPAWGKSGVVLARDERRKSLKVDLGGVSLWLSSQDLSRSPAQETTARSATVRAADDPPAGCRLDLRGLRADEALSRLGSFLDRAVLSGVSQVDIIHGRGTGALRREVGRFLQDFPAVASFALANEDEGGDGVTQARMR